MRVAITGSSGLAKIIKDTLEASPFRGETIQVSTPRIDDIIMKIVKAGRNNLGPATAWSIIIMDNNLGFVVLQQGAEFILAL